MIKLKSLIVLEKMSLGDAEKILIKYGIPNPMSMDKETLKKSVKQLALKHHPDRGGDTETMQLINAARDTLDDAPSTPSSFNNRPASDIPQSEPAQNIQDVNYVKWKAWDISGRPQETPENHYTFWNWDGAYFRGSFSVYAIPSKLFEISNMMSMWDHYNASKAVFVSQDKEENAIYLVKLHGNKIEPPRKFVHDSFNKNPGNDNKFVRKLRRDLASY